MQNSLETDSLLHHPWRQGQGSAMFFSLLIRKVRNFQGHFISIKFSHTEELHFVQNCSIMCKIVCFLFKSAQLANCPEWRWLVLYWRIWSTRCVVSFCLNVQSVPMYVLCCVELLEEKENWKIFPANYKSIERAKRVPCPTLSWRDL